MVSETRLPFRFLEVGPLSDAELSLRLHKTTNRDEEKQWVATYHFEILVGGRIAGGVRFRAENDFDVERYAGHLGYNVEPEFRGRHLAERACRLLLPLARAHGLGWLWITCDPDNHASRRTCERLGAQLIEIVEQDGQWFKCRYRLAL